MTNRKIFIGKTKSAFAKSVGILRAANQDNGVLTLMLTMPPCEDCNFPPCCAAIRFHLFPPGRKK